MSAQIQADQLGEIRNQWLTLGKHNREALVAITREIGKLGPIACEVLTENAQRLASGVQYGDFSDDRNFIRQGLEEALDQSNYLCVALKRLDKAAGAK